MIILGLHFGHDAGATIVRDGKVESCIIRERQTRVKHAITLDVKTIFKALTEAQIKANEVDYCAITSTQNIELIVDDPYRVSISLKNVDYLHKRSVNCSLREVLKQKTPSLSQGLLSCFNRNAPKTKETGMTKEFFSQLYPEYKKLEEKDIKYVGWIDNYVSVDNLWECNKTLNEIAQTDFSRILRSDFLRYGFHFPAGISLDGHVCPAFFINHHLCHAASSYYQSSFNEAAILTHDGGNGLGYDSGMLYYAEEHKIYPFSPHHLVMGCLYGYVAYRLNLGNLVSSGKLMGLSAYGNPRFFDRKFIGNWNDLVRISREEKIFDVFDYWIYHCLSLAKDGGYDLKPWGDPNRMTAPINVDIAASTQKLFEENILTMADILKDRLMNMGVNTNNLCLSGGSMLNCPTNSRIAKEGKFPNVFVEPGCDDSGLAIGAALYCYHNLLDYPLVKRETAFQTPFLGSQIEERDVLLALDRYSEQIDYEKVENWTEEAARELAENYMIVWFEGKSEVGPRALGHRSILADPRNYKNWEKVNQIKRRETWRPFAPAVLESEAKNWFYDVPIPSPYMLFTARVKSVNLPAVTHVDGTARIQTVNKMCGAFFDLLNRFFQITGVPVLLNTSFNGPGEPIVETPFDALKFFVDSELDTLYLNSYRVKHKLGKPQLKSESQQIFLEDKTNQAIAVYDSALKANLNSATLYTTISTNKPLVVGAPRSGFSLLISVIGKIQSLMNYEWTQKEQIIRKVVDLGSCYITSKYKAVFAELGITEDLIFNGEFHLLVGGPKWLSKENPDLASIRKYFGVKEMGDFVLIVSHPKEILDYYSVIHSHSSPQLWLELPYYKEYQKFSSIRNPIGMINSATFSLNAMASEYIQKFSIQESEDLIRQRLALYKLTNLDFFAGLLKFLKEYLDEFIKVKKQYFIVKWEDLINSPIPTIKSLAEELGISIDDEVAKSIWEPMAHKNILYYHKHNYPRGKGIVGDWKNSLVNEHMKIFSDFGFDKYLEELGYPPISELNPREYSPYQKLVARYIQRGEVYNNTGDPDLFGFAFNKSNIDASKFNFKSFPKKQWTHVERSTLTKDSIVEAVSEMAEKACGKINELLTEVINGDFSSNQSSLALVEHLELKLGKMMQDSQDEKASAMHAKTFSALYEAISDVPILVEEVNNYNIVIWKNTYYGLPQNIGNIDISSSDVSTIKGVVIEKSLERVKEQIEKYTTALANQLEQIICHASSTMKNIYQPQNLFWGDLMIWHTKSPPQYPEWLEFALPQPQKWQGIFIKPQQGNYERAPSTFTIMASNDKQEWESLLSVSDYKWVSDNWQQWNFDSQNEYKHYKMEIFANNGHPDLLTIERLAPIIDSIDIKLIVN